MLALDQPAPIKHLNNNDDFYFLFRAETIRGTSRSPGSQSFAKRRCAVALFTAPPKGPAMRIIAPMACEARGVRNDLSCRRRPVTALALQPSMRPGQRKFGFTIMIEAPQSPAVRIVAALTLRPELTVVMRILVTRRTCLRRIPVSRRLMALFARHCCVKSNQRERCYVVIELYFLAPTRLVVTLLTALPELPFVRVIRFVTAGTCHRELFVCNDTFMARRALCRFVRPVERKFGRLGVIE